MRLATYPQPVESFDPPSTPAMEVRVVPIHNFYIKSMVLSGDRSQFHRTQPAWFRSSAEIL